MSSGFNSTFISVYTVMLSKDFCLKHLCSCELPFIFPSPFSFRFLNRLSHENKEWKHVLILFAWGRCWNLSLEPHLFFSNSGSEPRLSQTALLLRKQPWVYFCRCFGFVVCWFVGFYSTWTAHLVSDVGFRRLIPSPNLGKAFKNGELSILPGQ